MSSEDRNMLKEHVRSISDSLSGTWEEEVNEDGEPMSAMDYLFDALDIEYILNSRRECIGARILVSFGGPNIWVNTRSGQVEGYWWGDSYTESYIDGIGLQDAVIELYEC